MTFSLLRAARALLLSVAATVTFNAAAALPPNYSDLWWNQDEPGWGVNISQQADTLFATFFVYGTGGQAVWYSVTLTYQSTSANGVVTYGGALYQTSGSPQGTPYDPALLRYRQVGDATIEFGDDAHGLLRYTADGVARRAVDRAADLRDDLAGGHVPRRDDRRHVQLQDAVAQRHRDRRPRPAAHHPRRRLRDDLRAHLLLRRQLRAAGAGRQPRRSVRVHERRARRR